MERINDGGPAFPVGLDVTGRQYSTEVGMTLRDYIAAKAMQGLIAQSGGSALESPVHVGAGYAYRMADAMLKAREVQS